MCITVKMKWLYLICIIFAVHLIFNFLFKSITSFLIHWYIFVARFNLFSADQYHYLNQSGCYGDPTINDVQDFINVKVRMYSLFSEFGMVTVYVYLFAYMQAHIHVCVCASVCACVCVQACMLGCVPVYLCVFLKYWQVRSRRVFAQQSHIVQNLFDIFGS